MGNSDKKNSNGNYYHVIVQVFLEKTILELIIPLGTITVEETKAPEGFLQKMELCKKNWCNISGTNNVYLFQFVDDRQLI